VSTEPGAGQSVCPVVSLDQYGHPARRLRSVTLRTNASHSFADASHARLTHSRCAGRDFSPAFLNGQPGWCVVTLIKTFLDETGVHGDAEMVAVGGYISRPKHWRAWTKDWNVHKRKVPLGRKPIKVFHSTDCANYRQEFEGWTQEDRDPYVAQLLPVGAPGHGHPGARRPCLSSRKVRPSAFARRDYGESAPCGANQGNARPWSPAPRATTNSDLMVVVVYSRSSHG
jgi:hypothetical protein